MSGVAITSSKAQSASAIVSQTLFPTLGNGLHLSSRCERYATKLTKEANDGDRLVNAPGRFDAAPILEDFPYQVTDNVRFADLDPNNHVNNVVYATYFETGRVTLTNDRTNRLMPEGFAWVMVQLDIHFRAELRWPGTVELGLGVAKLGRTSVIFDQVVFSNGICAASARAVCVLLDETTREATPLTKDIIRNLERWLRRGATGAINASRG